MISRNTPLPITPHNKMESRVSGLRDMDIPPSTYRKYQQQPDGTIVYVGEFPTPEVRYGVSTERRQKRYDNPRLNKRTIRITRFIVYSYEYSQVI